MIRKLPGCVLLMTLLGFGAALATPSAPQMLEAHVVKVNDGDSLEVRDSNGLVHRIRLAGIDAPEHDQPFGSRAKEGLSRLVLDKDVRLEIEKRDGYGRFVAKVWVIPPDAPCDVPSCPKTLDVGQALLITGLAWHYRKYEQEQTQEDRLRYAFEENEARVRRRGLWADPHARAPAEWRNGLNDGSIKKSRTGICHAPDSPAYRSVHHFTSFPTLDACLASGGRVPRS